MSRCLCDVGRCRFMRQPVVIDYCRQMSPGNADRRHCAKCWCSAAGHGHVFRPDMINLNLRHGHVSRYHVAGEAFCDMGKSLKEYIANTSTHTHTHTTTRPYTHTHTHKVTHSHTHTHTHSHIQSHKW